MSQPRDDVLILTGPPGSGKTTVARLLAGRRERAVHLVTMRLGLGADLDGRVSANLASNPRSDSK